MEVVISAADKRKSFVITTVIYTLLLLILFFIRFWPPANATEMLLAGGGGGVTINFGDSEHLFETYAIGIAVGLIIGKPLGITLISYLAVRFKAAQLPHDLSWKHITGAGILGGIGFTMSIFITLLAFEDAMVINNSKLFIVIASLISGVLGLLFLKCTLKETKI